MPELPDVTVYIERLADKVQGQVLKRVRVLNPFLLRTALPPLTLAEGQKVEYTVTQGQKGLQADDVDAV